METLFNNGALFFASEIKRKANAVGSCLQIYFYLTVQLLFNENYRNGLSVVLASIIQAGHICKQTAHQAEVIRKSFCLQ